MPAEITMPRLSDSMEEGTILTWLVEPGQEISEGSELVEIETDKATITYEAEAAGVFEPIADEGDTVAVGAPIARLNAASPAAAPAVDESAPDEDVNSVPDPPATSTVPPAKNEAGAATSVPGGANFEEAARATPLARRIAALQGLELTSLSGSGPRGRITKADALAAAGIPGVEAPSPARPSRPTGNGRVAETPTETRTTGNLQSRSRLQETVARRMSEAAAVPTFQVATDAVMDRSIELRAELKEAGGDVDPSLNDFVIKACALALRRHPRVNGSYREDGFLINEAVNVGIAVAAEGALIVPTIMSADSKSLGEVARDARRLAERVRSNEVTPEELEGGTFTVSNLGMYGMTSITPMLNLPQAAILGVGALREELRRDGDDLYNRTLMSLSLTCDHRILYGADGAEFLNDVKTLLEAPLRLTL